MPKLSFQTLMSGIKQVRILYEQDSQSATRNLSRYQLLDILEACAEFVEYLKNNHGYSEVELKPALKAIYLLGLHQIAGEYTLSQPEFSVGYFYHTGSRLYSLLLRGFGMTSDEFNAMTNEKKLISLTKFFQLAFVEHENHFKWVLQIKGLRIGVVRKHYRQGLEYLLASIDTEAMLAAIPTQAAFEQQFNDLLLNYLLRHAEKKEALVQEDINLLKIMMGCQQVLSRNVMEKEERGTLPRSQLISIGILLVVMHERWNSFWVLHARHRDVIYDLCCETLNITSAQDFTSLLQLQCLSTLDWVMRHKEKILQSARQIEASDILDRFYLWQEVDQILAEQWRCQLSRPVNIDMQVTQWLSTADQMKKAISEKYVSGSQRAVLSVAGVMALLGTLPGYGIGYVFNNLIQQSDLMIPPRRQLNKATHYGITLVAGDSANNCIGDFVANLFVDATLKHGTEKLLEALGMVVGAGIGMMGTLVIYELTWQTLYHLYQLCWQLHPHAQLGKDMDDKFVQCLLSLPPEVFTEGKKEKLRYLTQGTFFKPKFTNDESASELSTELESAEELEKQTSCHVYFPSP